MTNPLTTTLKLLVESLGHVFWLRNGDMSELLYISPAYERVWGRSPKAFAEDPLEWTRAIHPDDLPGVLASVNRVKRGEIWVQEYRLVRPDGEVRWIVDRGVPVADDAGRPWRVAGIAVDITERKRAEERLRQVQKLEAVGRLAGGVAHDFNNVLTAVGGYAELLELSLEPGDPRREDVQALRGSAQRGAELTNRLLMLGRRQSGTPEPVDISAFVSGMRQMLGRVLGEEIELKSSTPEPCWVKIDVAQLEQLIMSLVLNARDAVRGRSGARVVLQTARRRLESAYAHAHGCVPAGDWIELVVSDNGPGISEEVFPHLFEPFFTTKPRGEASGLGLATVYGIARQAGGEALVDPGKGKGARFRVLLPPTDERPAPPPRPAAGAVRGGGETLLVVDDEALVLAPLARLLKQAGYRVLCASSAVGAYAACEGEEVALLVTDVVMPKVNGVELAERLTRERPGLRVLFMSGYNEHPLLNEGGGLAERVLRKPFTREQLLARVRAALSEEAGAAGAERREAPSS